MGFRSSIMLMSHMVGHAAKRPCLCKECGLGFCHQQAYDSHLKTCGLANPAEVTTFVFPYNIQLISCKDNSYLILIKVILFI